MGTSILYFPDNLRLDLPETGIRRLTQLEMEAIEIPHFRAQTWVVNWRGSVNIALKTLPTPRGGMRLMFPCPYCGVHHLHGWGEGHRSSHCGVEAVHPWSRHGYYLLEPGQVVPT